MISLQLGTGCWGGGLVVRRVCMCELQLFVELGVRAVVYTISKCIWDLSCFSKGASGVCPHTLTISLLADHKTCKQQVGRIFCLFSLYLPHPCQWAVGQKDTSVQKSFYEQKDSPEGFFPSFFCRCVVLYRFAIQLLLLEGVTVPLTAKG